MKSPRRHAVIVSDFHLSEPEPGDGSWLRWRQRRFAPDRDFAGLVEHVLARVDRDDELEWIFAGDVFEFDGPVVEAGESRFVDAPPTAREALSMLDRVIAAHEPFFDAVARVVTEGHRVVFLAGNHDAQLAFPEVAEALIAKLVARAGDEAARARITVRPWFHRTQGGVHVEHGHQYDPYCAFRNPIAPVDARTGAITPTMGSLSFRWMVSRMGHFNAHDERTFMLSVPRYLAHWVRHYMFSRRSLGAVWLRGALRIVATLLRARPSALERVALREAAGRDVRDHAAIVGVPAASLARHAALFAEPADTTLHRVVRELHLDQLACLLVGVVGVALALFTPARLAGVVLAIAALALPLLQEWLFPRRPLAADQREVDAVARRIAEVHEVHATRAVVFGHTHRPYDGVEDGVLVANSGSWTPSLEETSAPAHAPLRASRPFVWLTTAADATDARIEGGLFRWFDGAIAKAAPAEAPRPAPARATHPSIPVHAHAR